MSGNNEHYDFIEDRFLNEYQRPIPFSLRMISSEEKQLATNVFLSNDLVSNGSANRSVVTYEASSILEGDPESDNFNFIDLLISTGVEVPKHVYLSYSDDIDELISVKIHDLNEYFDTFWYPASDDLEVIDEGMKWILNIHHAGEGCMRFLKLKEFNNK